MKCLKHVVVLSAATPRREAPLYRGLIAIAAVACAALEVASAYAGGCPKAECPIGVFDSGVGGLTVLDKLLSVDVVDNATGRPGADGIPDLQGERFTFLGDQANLPYGNYAGYGKSMFLRELAIRNALFLTSDGYYKDAAESFPGGVKDPAKIVVIACNTATAYGLKAIESTFLNAGARIRVVGVVNAGCRSVLNQLGAGPDSPPFAVGILSTAGTYASGAYPRTLLEEAAKRGMKNPPVAVALGCPHLADSIELGRPQVGTLARKYLADLMEAHRASGSKAPLRALILGCTHYPFVQRHFEDELSALRKDPKYAPLLAPDFRFIDPAVDTAIECRRLLAEDGLLANRAGESSVAAYVSIPSASLPPEKVQANGTLADDYKYGREPGRDVVDSKYVPIAKGTVDREAFYRLVDMLPAVSRHLRRE